MSEHLRHEEFVDAIEHTLEATRQAHLDECAECSTAVGELDGILNDTRAVDLPEPSPLFWDHFSHRVSEATAMETVGADRPWWHLQQWWRPVGILATALAAVVLVIVLRPGRTPAPASNEVEALVTPPDDGSWNLVIGLASDLDAKDVREVARPREGTADAMIAELSPAQRRALAQLIKDEIGEQ